MEGEMFFSLYLRTEGRTFAFRLADREFPSLLIVKSLGDAPEIFILFQECPASRSDSPSIDESTDDLPSIRLVNQPVTPQERP
ncbi:hypothetical protein AVEN_209017-1 [Araneus ventricosus]|uniref:Uncharacterized protein n=1 Tax=Araneus ventricosus TaxID=182803 RepID=A0A4Y2CJL8_ARAVE|nr:hypothetical protein AVEN_209017-1 [Araneus ventricosus]